MKGTTKVDFEVGGKTMTLETGLLAQQADGSVTCGIGNNVVFSAVTSAKEAKEGVDFFPLQVEYREKFYAAGRFPGGYIKREARPSEKEILTMRVTDRPIRTLFPDNFHREVQINNMLVSSDQTLDTDVLSVNAASTALTLTDLPFDGPIGAVRIVRNDGEWIINPNHDQLAASDIDLTYCGSREKVMMIEGSAQEIPEAEFVEAMKTAHAEVVKIIDGQLKLRAELGLPEKVYAPEAKDTTLLDKARELVGEKFKELMKIGGKLERQDAVSALKEELKPQMQELFPEMTEDEYFHAFHDLEVETVRLNVLEDNTRIGGRGMLEIRPLDIQVGVFPQLHGSAVFGRGETQTLCTVTLGTTKEAQRFDAVTGGADEKNFILHYNFPPYSVGECGRLGMTSRREIGHGNLAERSIAPVMPEDFPYTVRVVSEVMGSNGSSSMASACGGCLALMDAGVPLKAPVAGISVGLFTDGQAKSVEVIDILGVEDHCGDMDFKVVGTRKGITGFQVDLKVHGMDWDQVEEAFEIARKGRCDILDQMENVLANPREELAATAPRITTVQIDPEKIGALIGPGGKHIRAITDSTGAQIDIQEDGTVNIFAVDAEAMDAAIREVNALTAEIEIGRTYQGKVIAVKDFGAFVECMPGKEGLVHISEMANERIDSVDSICKPGDAMTVKCIDIDNQGRVRLSRKAALNDAAEAGE
ncbi:polyribonucleotide nucleotidyltransferase [Pontiella agarivorans]|uniref:Polyribonucleotide nucleotidyltransferase n=1 Tax=Pontiella agarivorans TaxID=3038953 RepID=A0ABU5N047_9BACT|nr:polyribonucleotide nucleotidyltransferase [Pontiella agarivorans]MDZ8119813.1 polyribonucleotide nucleotidyltransferase [Pontiella agarivorans]